MCNECAEFFMRENTVLVFFVAWLYLRGRAHKQVNATLPALIGESSLSRSQHKYS